MIPSPIIYILDNNIWVRLADPSDAAHETAQNAVKNLRAPAPFCGLFLKLCLSFG